MKLPIRLIGNYLDPIYNKSKLGLEIYFFVVLSERYEAQ